MKSNLLKLHFAILLPFLIIAFGCNEQTPTNEKIELTKIDSLQLAYLLPSPSTKGNITVEEALLNRRSHRNFQDRAISAGNLSQILWAAYGVTVPRTDYSSLRGGLRTAPSAGALYPLDVYVLIGNVKDIEPGFYKYISQEHKIVRLIDKDVRVELCDAALNQEMVREAPAVLFYSAVYSRCTDKYGKRGRERYVCMDLGHSAQNVYLQVETLKLGTCAIGAFNDEKVKEILQLQAEEEPLYMMPFGYYYDKIEF